MSCTKPWPLTYWEPFDRTGRLVRSKASWPTRPHKWAQIPKETLLNLVQSPLIRVDDVIATNEELKYPAQPQPYWVPLDYIGTQKEHFTSNRTGCPKWAQTDQEHQDVVESLPRSAKDFVLAKGSQLHIGEIFRCWWPFNHIVYVCKDSPDCI